ncbi:site-specific integrase [Limibaculum sp. M0105]|uniref:Site-specific integrase n=1 Tax=Thermohalobaculum xanthum TaxID=2753746 RepID=A0A8J7M6C5_9RHOB|nr:site-specific integrase [Thermohalobaculum xanthum]MBK0399068.1 site-specific integrase [Thermohalobaculum xanthum]
MPSISKIEGKRGISWKAVVRRRGVQTVSQSFKRKTDAEAWARNIEAGIDAGRFRDGRQARKHTVGELIERYISEIIPLKRSGKVQIQQLGFWRRHLGALRLSELTPDRILSARAELMKRSGATREVGPATVNRYMAALSHALSVAEKQYGWLEDNPMRRVPRLKEPQGRVRHLSDEERKRLLDACQQSSNPYLLPFVLIALTTGMRRGEIERLTWADLDWERDRITIHETKNGERRSAALLKPVKLALTELREKRLDPKALVFPSRIGSSPANIMKAWYAAVHQADIADFKFHDLRHTAASYLAMDGASLPEIGAVLGHKTPQMTKRYAHFSDAHTRRVVERTMGRLFENDE